MPPSNKGDICVADKLKARTQTSKSGILKKTSSVSTERNCDKTKSTTVSKESHRRPYRKWSIVDLQNKISSIAKQDALLSAKITLSDDKYETYGTEMRHRGMDSQMHVLSAHTEYCF